VLVGGTAAGLVDATTGEGIHEAATTGRFAAEAARGARRGRWRDPARWYERTVKHAFYRRLEHRYRLMKMLERKPARFDVLFRQLQANPRFAELLQRDRTAFGPMEWMYLYAQAAKFGVAALQV
jgi:flavin-dependent dehydrogenase